LVERIAANWVEFNMRKKGNVLVVDSEGEVRQFLEETLRSHGYNVLLSSAPDEGINILKKEGCDVILADLAFPEGRMGGIEFVEAVKEYDSDILLIITVPPADVAFARHAVRRGAYSYVLKPLDLNVMEIVLAVNHAVEKIRLIEENKRLNKINRVYGATTGAVKHAYAGESLLQCMLYCAVVQTCSDSGSIMLWNKEENGLKTCVSSGFENDIVCFDEEHVRHGVENFFIMLNRKNGDCNAESLYTKNLSVPLKVQNKTLGVLNVFSGNNTFSDSDLDVLQIIANQAAIYLDRCDLFENLQESFLKSVESLAVALEAKDLYTHGHSKRVGSLSAKIGRVMGLSDCALHLLRQGGLIHDIGKIGIRDDILNKEGTLTTEELRYCYDHPNIGDEILKPLGSFDKVRQLVRNHHERFDGCGYPDRLNGDEVTLEVSIISLADAFDAMNSNRPYRNALSKEEIRQELQKNRGTQFNPKVVDAMMYLIDKEGLLDSR